MSNKSLNRKHRILLIADETVGASFKGALVAKGYEVKIIKSFGRLKVVYFELSRQKYDILILTNTSLRPRHILRLVPVIKLKFPKTKILVLSGWDRVDFITTLKLLKIDDFFLLPIGLTELVTNVNKLVEHQH